ncbi:MAG: hypothetical protein ACOYOL_11300 [Chthoniobacterales bacterium]
MIHANTEATVDMAKESVRVECFHAAGAGWHKVGVKAKSITPTAKAGESGMRAANTAQ